MRAFKLLLPTILLVVCVSVLLADTIHVPSNQPTIQAGIDAAVDGDTVLVADGTYTGWRNRNLDFGGKAIVVVSENGPESCIIDCSHYGRGFHFHSGETETSIVQGFTITNGTDDEGSKHGGAIRCINSSSPTIKGNVIINNAVT
jgi:hypothetical protein